MIKIFPFSLKKYSSEKSVSEIFNSLDDLISDEKSQYSFGKNKENKTFWFKEDDYKTYGKTYFYKVKVQIKEFDNETIINTISIASSTKLFFLVFIISQLLLILYFAEHYAAILLSIIIVMYLIILNYDQNEYIKPEKDLIRIIK